MAMPRDTTSNETTASLNTKKETTTTDTAKLVKLKPFHPPKEPKALRMNQAKLTKTETWDHFTTVPHQKVASAQVLDIPVSDIDKPNPPPPHNDTRTIGKPTTKGVAINNTTIDKAGPQTLCQDQRHEGKN